MRATLAQFLTRYPWLIIFLLVALITYGSFTVGYFFLSNAVYSQDNEKHNNNKYHFINPLLECNNGASISTELKPFKQKLLDIIGKKEQRGEASFVSVYFRDLNNGPWFGINESEPFIPASLMKVPIMLAFYNEEEDHPGLLKKKIPYTQKLTNSNEYFTSAVTLQLGQSYTVEDLLNHMIQYSDNEAATLLMNNGGDKLFRSTLNDLGFDYEQLINQALMTVRQYSSFFRILFNASYLNKADSEKVLALLASTEFKQGLVAGVPDTVPVAHKFGERWLADDTVNNKQLHDCGIVYYPYHPYLLCIMSRGDSFQELVGTISDLSHAVYQEVDKQYNQ